MKTDSFGMFSTTLGNPSKGYTATIGGLEMTSVATNGDCGVCHGGNLSAMTAQLYISGPPPPVEMPSGGGGAGGGGGGTTGSALEVISVTTGMTSYNSPSINVTVKNTGSSTVYNVGCQTNALNSSDTILDTAQTFFASHGDIAPGVSAQDEGVFFNLSSHSDYATLDATTCTWLTR